MNKPILPPSITTKLVTIYTFITLTRQTAAIVWEASGFWSMLNLLLLFIRGVLPVASVYIIRELINSMIPIINAGGNWETIKPTVLWIVLLGAVLLLTRVLSSILNWVRTVESEFVQDYIKRLIHDKTAELDLAFFENPEFYDCLHRASIDAVNRPVALLQGIGNIIQHSITLLAMAVVLANYGLWIPVILILSAIPASYVVFRYARFHNQLRLRTTQNRRYCNYYDGILTSRENAPELRLFGLHDHFKNAYRLLRRQLRNDKISLAKNQALAELIASSLILVATAFVMLWMIWKAMDGDVTLGDLALFYQAFNHGQSLIRTFLSSAGQTYSNSLFIENLFQFLSLKPTVMITDSTVKHHYENLTKGITFHNVSFQYPNSERMALDKFNMTIPAGKLTAVVGTNGAGKSTIIKLLCRFYDPTEGYITFDDRKLTDLPPEDIRSMSTVLFQEPVHYYETAQQNINLGNIVPKHEFSDIAAAAQDAGAESVIKRLPDSYKTVLGKFFGGEELSVGEWQRIALARAFLRKTPIIILDEPTSAMDPWAEAEWLERFSRLIVGRTAIVITHRFTTANKADLIHVMDAGSIIESGNHTELMNLKGKYATSWEQQTRNRNICV